MGDKYSLLAVGRKNKAESLYLLKGHEPRHRKFGHRDPDAGIAIREHVDDGTIHERVVEAAVKNEKDASWAVQWQDTMGCVAERFPNVARNKDIEERFGPFGSKVTKQEAESIWEGSPPKNEDLPDWIRETILVEDGGLAEKKAVVETVRLAIEFKGYPLAYKTIYGLLDRHSHGTNTTWVSVERLAKESGYTPQYVGRILRRMEHDGLIRTEMRPGKSSIYTLLASSPGAIGLIHRIPEKKTERFVDFSQVQEP
jgi:hypothetical protein